LTAVSLDEASKKMPLHRDIYWVGKQWSVTGHGMQAIDQKLKGEFDIEVSRLWDDGLHDELRDEKWFNANDFDKGLAAARKHYPEPPGRTAPKARKAALAPAVPASPDDSIKPKDQPKAPAAPTSANFAMHIESGRAKFLTIWRVRVHWQR
jgi:hypothetical protein